MKKRIRTTKKGFPESRAGQIDREIDALVFGFVGKPSKKVSDSLYYLTRERAQLLRTKRRIRLLQSEDDDASPPLAVAG